MLYYVARTQRSKRYVKQRWFDQHFPDHEIIVEIDNRNSIHAFNRFEEDGHEEHKYNHFRLIDLTREELYAMRVPVILDDEEEEQKFFFSEYFLNFHDLNEVCVHFIDVIRIDKDQTLFNFLHQPYTKKSCNKNNYGPCMLSSKRSFCFPQ